MVNNDLLQDYSNKLTRLKKESLQAGMTEDEFRKIYFESLNAVQHNKDVTLRNQRRYKNYQFIFLLLISVFLIIYYFKSIYSCLTCNLQEYIYPGMRLLRRLSIPLISLFPSLTGFYHETCLIQNPFFTVVDMDCWPCSTIHNVREVYGKLPDNQQVAPFIYETNQPLISLDTLMQKYLGNREIFDQESPKILSDNKKYVNFDEMFHAVSSGLKGFYVWKFNTMKAARILRQFIPRPEVVPKFGQSTERFVIVDYSQSAFRVPDTECNYSFLLLLSGTRTIELIPAEECKHQCKVLKVKLKESHLLWYNWWYWRPVIQPTTGNDTMIAHVGSYC